MKTREAAVEIPKAVEVVRRAALAPEAVERWDEVLRQVDPVLPVLEHVLRVVLREEIDDTSQSDLEKATSNWYVMNALVPFTRGEVQAGGRIALSILGDDAWKPMALFVFGLDTA